MKRKFIYIVSILLVLSTLICMFSGCAMFNDGSVDELKGIYKLSTYTYNAKNNKTYNCSGNYEYFILVIDDNSQATLIYKFEDNEEVRYSTKYKIEYKENSNKVSKIVILDFSSLFFVSNSESDEVLDAYNLISDRSFSLQAIRENLHMKDYSPSINSSFKWESTTEIITFHKMTKKVNEKNIEKAIKRNKEEKEKRGSNINYKGDYPN